MAAAAALRFAVERRASQLDIFVAVSSAPEERLQRVLRQLSRQQRDAPVALNLIVKQVEEALDLELQVKEELDFKQEAQLADARVALECLLGFRHVRLGVGHVLVDAPDQVSSARVPGR